MSEENRYTKLQFLAVISVIFIGFLFAALADIAINPGSSIINGSKVVSLFSAFCGLVISIVTMEKPRIIRFSIFIVCIGIMYGVCYVFRNLNFLTMAFLFSGAFYTLSISHVKDKLGLSNPVSEPSEDNNKHKDI